MKKTTKYLLHSRSQVILIIGIVVVINILLSGVALRWDMTDGNQYTLSAASKNIIKELQNPLTFKVFFSKEVPQNMLALKQDVKDLMAEYKRVGKGNVTVEFADPKQDAAALQEARTYGIPEIQYNVVGNEKFEVSTGYAGLAMIVGDQQETIPVLADSQNLEYDVTIAVHKMTRADIPTIAFLSDHGVTETQTLQQYLRQQYTVKPVTLDELADVQNLIIAGPTAEFTEKDKYLLDQFLMKGGNAIVLLEGVNVDEQYLQVTPNKTGLETLLASYGVTVNNNLVADFLSAEALTFGGGTFSIIQEYPYWPKIIKDGFSANHPITSSLRSLVLPWPSSLNISTPEGVEVNELAYTSPQSFAYTDATSAAPNAIVASATTTRDQQLVAALLSGPFKSAYADKDKPAEVDSSQFINNSTQSRLLVVGDAQFMGDNILQQSLENGLLVLNAIDLMAQDESFIDIRARSSYSRPINPLTDTQKATIKYANIFSGIVIVVIVAGAMYLWRRRRDKKIKELYYV